MAWDIIYFIIAIAAAVAGIWNLAQKRNIFLAVASIVFFLAVLFRFIAKIGVIEYPLIGTTVGDLAIFALLPILIIFAFFARRTH